MRCPACGRDGQRSRHERNVSKLLGWLLAIAFTLGAAIGTAAVTAAGTIIAALR